MRKFLSILMLTSSFSVFATDLEDGDVAKLDYSMASIFKVLKVERKVTSVVYSGVRYYTANLRFHVIAEGNTCGGLRSSLGVRHEYKDNSIVLDLQTGTRKTNAVTECAEYSKETRIVIPEVLDLGDDEDQTQMYELGHSTVKMVWKNKKLSAVITNEEEEKKK